MKSFYAEFFVLCVFFCCVQMKMQYVTYPEQISKSTQYDPQVLRKSCLLKPDPGPCRANIPMYYFHPEAQNCTVFKWGGCMGNGNRFDTEEDCNNTCVSKPDEKPQRPRYCFLSFDYGYCFGAVTRWYYDSMWKVCKETIYSGCGGNKNNFYSLAQCESICRLNLGMIPSNDGKKGASRKVVIINPKDATTKRGKNQSLNQTIPMTNGYTSTLSIPDET